MNTLWEALSGHLEEADELNEKVTAKLSAARGRLSSAVRRKSAAPPAVDERPPAEWHAVPTTTVVIAAAQSYHAPAVVHGSDGANWRAPAVSVSRGQVQISRVL